MAKKRLTSKVAETEAFKIEVLEPPSSDHKWRTFYLTLKNPNKRKSISMNRTWVKRRYGLAHNGDRFAVTTEFKKACHYEPAMMAAVSPILARYVSDVG